MNYIQAENRVTGKPKFFTETGWRNLQKSNITNPYQKMKAPASAPKNLIPNKAVQVPKEVLDFKAGQKTEAGAGDTNQAEELIRDYKMFPEGEKGDLAWAAWVTENGGTPAATSTQQTEGATGPAPAANAGAGDTKEAHGAKEPASKGKGKGGN